MSEQQKGTTTMASTGAASGLGTIEARLKPYQLRLVRWLAIVILLGASWGAAVALGGSEHIAPHWFYIPIMLAGLWFGSVEVAVVGLAATVIAGPLLPGDVARWSEQETSDWVSRGVFFLAIGLVVARMFALLRRFGPPPTPRAGARGSPGGRGALQGARPAFE